MESNLHQFSLCRFYDFDDFDDFTQYQPAKALVVGQIFECVIWQRPGVEIWHVEVGQGVVDVTC